MPRQATRPYDLDMTHERTGPGLDGAPAAFYGIGKDDRESPVAKADG